MCILTPTNFGFFCIFFYLFCVRFDQKSIGLTVPETSEMLGCQPPTWPSDLLWSGYYQSCGLSLTGSSLEVLEKDLLVVVTSDVNVRALK